LFKEILSDATAHGKSEFNRIGYLDGWRGIAIASVLIAHFSPIKGLDWGRMGVDIFFVLSGMLMSNILFVKKVDLITFYKRRISRILPVFFIFVSFICLLSYFLNLSNEHDNYFYLLSFLRSYFPESPDIWHTGLPVGHLWSLNVEEHYYIFLSLIVFLRIFKGKEFIPLIVLGIGAILLHYIYIKYPSVSSGFITVKTEIVASHLFLSSGYFLIKHKFERFVFPWMPVASFILGVLCYSKFAHSAASWILSPFLFAFTVNHLDRVSKPIQQVLSNRVLQLLGVYSFSIYLWQQPFHFYGVKGGPLFPFAGLVFLAGAIFIGILSFYYIENPIRKYLNNHW
jgi:peptidoglycan/LPS O-acetylase OafA/YrhL